MPTGVDDDEALRETLSALEMPREGLARWLAQSRAFCQSHGGERVYAELLSLFADCDRLLAEGERGPGR